MADMIAAMPFDVAIVGAGPAGSACAALIAARRPAWRVVLVEARAVPVARACGEFIAPGGVAVLDEIGALASVLASGARVIAGLRLHGPGATLTRSFAPHIGLGVRRERLDAVLQTVASRVADRRQGRVTALLPMADGWRLVVDDGTQLDARLVIGADGRGSGVRRFAGLERPHRRQRFALACRARGVAHGDHGEMHLATAGQVGLCPLGDGEVNLNLLLAPGSRALLAGLGPERLLASVLATTPSLNHRLDGLRLGRVFATGSLPQASAVIGRRVALIGDAAGFCDPFTGEGIDLALASARLLAIALEDDDPARSLTTYHRAWRRVIGRRHARGEWLQAALARRPVAGALLRAAVAQGSIARSLMHR